MNKDQQKLKKSLLDAIKQVDFETVEKVACAIEWKQFYTQSSFSLPENSEETQGVLFDLFPMGIEKTDEPYYDYFSKKCLRLFVKHGYDPSQDMDIRIDFFTECNRQCFKDFCGEIKKQPDVLKKIFLSFWDVSLPWYEEHLEYLMHPCLGEISENGMGLVEQIWIRFGETRNFVLSDPFVVDSYIKTSRALEKHCLKTPEQKENLVQTMREQQECFHEAYHHNHEQFKNLENYINGLIARVEKSLLNEGLYGKLRKDQPMVLARKM